jgi:hypothetical protein
MRVVFSIATVAFLLLGALPLTAMPILRTADLTLSVGIPGLGSVSIQGRGTVTVDSVAGTVHVPAVLDLQTSVAVPVSGTVPGFPYPIVSLIARGPRLGGFGRIQGPHLGVGNLSGTFSLGRAITTATRDICPAADNRLGCIEGGGLNGALPLTGTVSFVYDLPGTGADATYPIVLRFTRPDLGVGLPGIPIGFGSGFFDNAPWTTGVARLGPWVHTLTTTSTATFLGNTFTVTNTTMVTSTITSRGSSSPGQIRFVTPTHIKTDFGPSVPVMTSFTIKFVPEPAAVLLVGFGLVLLAATRMRLQG